MRRFITALILASLLVFTFPQPTLRARRQIKKGSSRLSPQRGVDTISANQMRDYLTFIASDEMEGRDTPSRGLDTTAKFLAMNLARWGFKPAGDNGTFFQRIELSRNRVDSAQTNVELNGRIVNSGHRLPSCGWRGRDQRPTGFRRFSGWFRQSPKRSMLTKASIAPDKIAVVFGSAKSISSWGYAR